MWTLKHLFYLDDSLTQKIVRFPRQLLSEFGFQIIILVPYSYFNAVWWIVAFTVEENSFLTHIYAPKYNMRKYDIL